MLLNKPIMLALNYVDGYVTSYGMDSWNKNTHRKYHCETFGKCVISC